MEVFVILESFTDFKGGNATSWGVCKSKESAILAMPDLIAQRFGFGTKADFEEEYGFFDSGFINEEHTHWMWDRDDSLIEFYIQSDEILDD